MLLVFIANTLLACVCSALGKRETLTIPNELYKGPITAEIAPDYRGFDLPKLGPTGASNATSYEWWYFDAVSASHPNKSVVIVFYNTGPKGFLNPYFDVPLWIDIRVSLADGTNQFAAGPIDGSATLEYHPSGVEGVWGTSGFSFVGSDLDIPSLTKYIVTVDHPDSGFRGNVTFTAKTPKQYPCSQPDPEYDGDEELDPEFDGDEELMPHVYGNRALPDANAVVDLWIDEDWVGFDDGVGYHDKNWGDVPITEGFKVWYWGHARLGPYSLVWHSILDDNDREWISAFVAHEGKPIAGGCYVGAVEARPWGTNGEYPPTMATGLNQGLEVRFLLGNGTLLVANVTNGLLIADFVKSGHLIYARTIGSVTGGVEGDERVYEGVAVLEEFKFANGPGMGLLRHELGDGFR